MINFIFNVSSYVICGRYPPGMYSCIAGFLDVGESMEECVRRESAEEVGILVEKVGTVTVCRYCCYRYRTVCKYRTK